MKEMHTFNYEHDSEENHFVKIQIFSNIPFV